jgi:hypothetical protein
MAAMDPTSYQDYARGVTADLYGYEPPHQVGGEPIGNDDYVCNAAGCGPFGEMRHEVQNAGVKGPVQGGGARSRRHRRPKKTVRRSRRRSQRGGASRRSRYMVNARIHIRYPRH